MDYSVYIYIYMKKGLGEKEKGVKTKKVIKSIKDPEKECSGRRPIPRLTYVGLVVAGGIFL